MNLKGWSEYETNEVLTKFSVYRLLVVSAKPRPIKKLVNSTGKNSKSSLPGNLPQNFEQTRVIKLPNSFFV